MDPRSLTGAGTVLADRPPAAPGRRARTRVEPQRRPQFAHLSLEQLRAFRTTLSSEEAQVSYWRRVIQARLDLLRAGTMGHAEAPRLRPLLTDARVAGSRRALVDVVPVAEVPPLPSLAELWERRVDAEDEAGRQALEQDLAVAERQISDYRRSLHERIDDATGELIARYREAPARCLDVLPLDPRTRPAADPTG